MKENFKKNREIWREKGEAKTGRGQKQRDEPLREMKDTNKVAEKQGLRNKVNFIYLLYLEAYYKNTAVKEKK